jgi:hypothetical protein
MSEEKIIEIAKKQNGEFSTADQWRDSRVLKVCQKLVEKGKLWYQGKESWYHVFFLINGD